MKSNSEDGVIERDNANDTLSNPQVGFNDPSGDENSCRLKTFERVRYFDGQLLTADDFTVEQAYHNDKRHLTNKMVNGCGIVRGLKVELLPFKVDEGDLQAGTQKIKFVLHSGMAIDRCGRELIVDNKRELSVDVSDHLRSKQKKIGIFLKRKDDKFRGVLSYITSTDDQFDFSRLQESCEVGIDALDGSDFTIDFDKKSYSLYEKVLISVYDPDSKLESISTDEVSDEISQPDNIPDENAKIRIPKKNKKITVRSTSDAKGIDIILTNQLDLSRYDKDILKSYLSESKDPRVRNYANYYENLYTGQLYLVNDESSNENNRLKALNGDIVYAEGEGIRAQAYVNYFETNFLFNIKEVISEYCDFVNSPDHQAPHENSTNDQGILLAVIKINYKNENDDNNFLLDHNAFEIDNISTALRRENVYNNYMLYDLLKGHTVSQKDHYPLVNCTVTSAKYYVANFAELKPNCYLITDPIPIFSDDDEKFYKDANLELDGPPIIYIGRADEDDPDNKVMYFEDIDFNVIINNKKYKPDKPTDLKKAQEINLHLIQSVSFKPISITTSDFRLLVTKDYEREETSQSQLILRWWAVCKFRFKENL